MLTRRRSLVLAAAMAGAAAVSALPRRVGPSDAPRERLDLAALFPDAFGEWRVDPRSSALVRPADAQGKAYGLYDQVLERTFVNPAGARVMLSVAYGGEQSNKLQLHRPEVCYRANGYEVGDAHAEPLRLAGRSLTATRLHANRPGRSEPITYWTVLGGEVAAGNLSFQWRRAAHSLRGEVLDGLLVRISTVDHDTARAYALQAAFAATLAEALPPAARDKVLGVASL